MKSIKGAKLLKLGYNDNEVAVNPLKNIIIVCASMEILIHTIWIAAMMPKT
jgi:hypothetical protein